MKPTPETDAVYPPEIIDLEFKAQGREFGWGTIHDMRECCRKLERERDEARASNAELLERLRERTESHIAASARDVQDNQRLRVENDAMRKAISQLYDMTAEVSDK